MKAETSREGSAGQDSSLCDVAFPASHCPDGSLVPQAGDGAPDCGARYAERLARCRRLRVAPVAEETDVIMKRKPGQPGGEPERTLGPRALAVIESVLARFSVLVECEHLAEGQDAFWVALQPDSLLRGFCWEAAQVLADGAACSACGRPAGIRVVIAWLSLSRSRAWRSISGCARRAATLTSPRRRFCAKPKL